MTIVRVSDFTFEVPDGGQLLQFEVSGFGVLAGDRRIVIDPWLAFDEKRSESDGRDRWHRIAKELSAAGLDPVDIDTVVFTHLDGVGWALGPDDRTPGFPNARHLISRIEIDALHEGHRQGSEGAATLVELGLVDDLEPGEIAPGVHVTAAPGHTSGSVVVHVDDEDGAAVFVGHLFLHPAQLEAIERTELNDDPAMTITTRRVVLDDAAARSAKLFGDLWASPGWSYAP